VIGGLDTHGVVRLLSSRATPGEHPRIAAAREAWAQLGSTHRMVLSCRPEAMSAWLAQVGAVCADLEAAALNPYELMADAEAPS
jgi:hypothetical protein